MKMMHGVLYYRLTEIGKPIALEHQHHHLHTLHTYEDVLSKFTKNEQGVYFEVFRFIGRGVIV